MSVPSEMKSENRWLARWLYTCIVHSFSILLVHVNANGFFYKVNVHQFLELLTSFKPDIVQCLCDTVPDGQTTKRNKKSVDRTLKFLDEILEYQKNCKVKHKTTSEYQWQM